MNEKIDIKEYLSQFSGQEIIYQPNPGNAGDYLIAYATIQLMKELDIRYTLGLGKTFKDKVIFYGGGGNLVPMYDYCANFVTRNHKDNKLIVLSHTIFGHENVLKELSKETVLICREQTSLDYVKKAATNATSYLSDDIAFSAKIPEHLKNNKIEITGYCFRQDKEQTNIALSQLNKDLSSIFSFKGTVRSEESIKYATHIFLNALSVFETVHTNRLHIAIAGILLEQKVHFYPNNYYKCRSVFYNSIKDKYENVIWHDE